MIGQSHLRWAINSAYAIFLVVAAVLPSGPALALLTIPDWFAHAVAYGVQAGLLFWAAGSGDRPVPGRVAIAIGGAVALGLLTEGLQMLGPGRSAELADVLADAAGAVAVVGCVATGLVLSRRVRP